MNDEPIPFSASVSPGQSQLSETRTPRPSFVPDVILPAWYGDPAPDDAEMERARRKKRETDTLGGVPSGHSRVYERELEPPLPVRWDRQLPRERQRSRGISERRANAMREQERVDRLPSSARDRRHPGRGLVACARKPPIGRGHDEPLPRVPAGEALGMRQLLGRIRLERPTMLWHILDAALVRRASRTTAAPSRR